MNKHKQIKRNHHYVWKFYLKSWATGGDIFYISKKGKIACDSIKGLAREIDFYKISVLNQEDIMFVKMFSEKSPKFLQEIHMSFLDDFIKISNSLNLISARKDVNESVYLPQKVLENNSLENLHSFMENAAVEVVSKLARGESKCLELKDNMIAFCSYIGHQISRTKSFKENIIESINENPDIEFECKKLFEKNWWFLSFIFGINIGSSLYDSKDRDNHIFITNNTEIPFLTSDNPFINVHSCLTSTGERDFSEIGDFYIPLSPKYAYMINSSGNYNYLSKSIRRDDVERLNKKIVDKSYRTIFGSSEEVLKIHNKRVT